MRILVMSDTHGNFPLAFKACEDAGEFDLLIHLGDGESDFLMLKSAVIAESIHVAGNCDIGSTSPRELIYECDGKRLFFTHGNMYGVKSGYSHLVQRARELKADVALFGHTHITIVEEYQDVTLINPGTLAKQTSFNSYAILDVTADGVHVEQRSIQG